MIQFIKNDYKVVKGTIEMMFNRKFAHAPIILYYVIAGVLALPLTLIGALILKVKYGINMFKKYEA